MIRIGHAWDTHQLTCGRRLILGGIEIPHNKGLLGHSDADVLTHAICEAIIGALGLGDIGTFFPDTDPQYANIDSLKLLTIINQTMQNLNYEINNIDATIYLEAPNLKNYKKQIKEKIAKTLQINAELVNIKATRGEKMGFIGREEGIAAEAVILLKKTP